MLKKIFISGFILLGIVVGGEVRAQVIAKTPVIRDSGFQGKYVSQSEPDPIRMQAGEKKTVTVVIKNTGKTAGFLLAHVQSQALIVKRAYECDEKQGS